MKSKILSRAAVVLAVALLTNIVLATAATAHVVCSCGRCQVMPVEPLNQAYPLQGPFPNVDARAMSPVWRPSPGFDNYRRVFTMRGPLIAYPVGDGLIIVVGSRAGHVITR